MARLQGYPGPSYSHAASTQQAAATACHALLLHRNHTGLLFKSLQQQLGPALTCADLALRLREADREVAVAGGSVMFWGPAAAGEDGSGGMPAQLPAAFYSSWRQQLWRLVNSSYAMQVRAALLLPC